MSQHSPSQNSLTFSKLSNIYTDKTLWLYWRDGLEGPLNPPNGSKWKQFHGFGWFWVPTEEWNETASWKRKTRFKAKVNIYLKPCICLKSVNKGAAGKFFLNFWNLAFQNEKIDREWTDLPIQNIPPCHRTTPPLKSKILWPPLKTQNSNFSPYLNIFPICVLRRHWFDACRKIACSNSVSHILWMSFLF